MRYRRRDVGRAGATFQVGIFIAQLLVFAAEGLILHMQLLNEIEQLGNRQAERRVSARLKVDVRNRHMVCTETAPAWMLITCHNAPSDYGEVTVTRGIVTAVPAAAQSC